MRTLTVQRITVLLLSSLYKVVGWALPAFGKCGGVVERETTPATCVRICAQHSLPPLLCLIGLGANRPPPVISNLLRAAAVSDVIGRLLPTFSTREGVPRRL